MMENNDQARQAEYDRCRTLVEERLDCFFIENSPYKTLMDSMRYSLLAGGKRIRAVICLKFCEAAGGGIRKALDAACAIEMLHTYSLIHDDLPCMDDDDLRRGMPSNHIKFGEFTATLAGDALQAASFETLLSSGLPPAAVIEMARILAHAAGPHGICGGQYLDLQLKQCGTAELTEIYRLKTAELISAAARIGVAAAEGSAEQAEAADNYARAVGMAFQVRDDVLDDTATEKELGKPIGSDRENDKKTFASLMELSECEKIIRTQTEIAISALDGKFDDTEFLIWLAWMMANRKS